MFSRSSSLAFAVLFAACASTGTSSKSDSGIDSAARSLSPQSPVCAEIRSADREASPAVSVPVQGSRLHVIALGDFGDGSGDQTKVANAMEAYLRGHSEMPASFGLTLGDNFYSEGLQERTIPWQTLWEDPYAKLGLLFFATLGNHDYSDATPEQEIEYSSPSWCMPQRFYTFMAGPVQFFALDTEPLASSGGDSGQLQWLSRALQESQAPWKVVYAHHPIFSNGSHGDDSNVERLRGRLLPLLQNRAHVYLTGHDHDMQLLTPKGGVQFLVAGGGGHNLRPLRVAPAAPEWGVGCTLGFAALEATEEELIVRLIDTAGTALCTVRLDRNGKATKDCPPKRSPQC